MRGIILILEASTSDASVVVLVDGHVAASTNVASRDPHTGVRTEGLASAIVSTVSEAGVTMAQLTAIMCSAGPGGFTSLRSAAAIAKGLCVALGLPLYTVPTAALLVAGAQLPTGTYVVALDAGRGEYYATLVDVVDTQIQQIGAVTLASAASLDQMAGEHEATIIGGQSMHPHASAVQFLDDTYIQGPVDIDAWEPAYGRLAEAQVKWEATHGQALQW